MIEPCMVALASARIRGVVCERGGGALKIEVLT